jgi:hypothetical protein
MYMKLDALYTIFYVVHKLLYIVYTHNLVRNCVAILSGKKGSGRNRVTNFLRNRGVISRVEKGKIAQSCFTDCIVVDTIINY